MPQDTTTTFDYASVQATTWEYTMFGQLNADDVS